jgi:hypothetical protein
LGRSQAKTQEWEGACLKTIGGVAVEAEVPESMIAYVQAKGIGAKTGASLSGDQKHIDLKQ